MGRLVVGFVLITALVAVYVIKGRVDCSDPAVWGTERGVQVCAVNGGE